MKVLKLLLCVEKYLIINDYKVIKLFYFDTNRLLQKYVYIQPNKRN